MCMERLMGEIKKNTTYTHIKNKAKQTNKLRSLILLVTVVLCSLLSFPVGTSYLFQVKTTITTTKTIEDDLPPPPRLFFPLNLEALFSSYKHFFFPELPDQWKNWDQRASDVHDCIESSWFVFSTIMLICVITLFLCFLCVTSDTSLS